MGDVVQLRDYRRKEEREAAVARAAYRLMELIDTAPSEFSPAASEECPFPAREHDPA